MSRFSIAIDAVVVVLVLLIVPACSPQLTEQPHGQGLDGIWRTEGYGHIVTVAGAQARFWEVTAVSCLLGFDSGVETLDDAEIEAALIIESPSVRIDVLRGDSPDEKWLSIDGLASRRRLVRIGSLPAKCGEDRADDPVFDFDVFWQTFQEHYPFFEMKGVDWAAVRQQERSHVSSETTDQELFGILEGMIEPLEDAHTYLSAPEIDRNFHGRRPGPAWLDDAERAEVLELIDNEYLESPSESRCNDQMAIGELAGGVRYFRLSSFGNYGSDFRDGLDCLEAVLTDVLAEPESMQGLVIDIRINPGGADPYGLAIASRLASTEYLAYTKETRNDTENPDGWSAGQPSMVSPREGAGFTGPVVLLTGPFSVSAAETFTMALMGRTPRVTRIGQTTQGVFSDVLGRTLPNGWSFGLPNERFLTGDGRSFDGLGIEPDIEIRVFAPEDLAAGRDLALEQAMEVLALP